MDKVNVVYVYIARPFRRVKNQPVGDECGSVRLFS
jgi:hypothetical protein